MDNDNNREQELRDFAKKLIESQQDIDPEIQLFVNEHFWELFEKPTVIEEFPVNPKPTQFPHFTTSTTAIPEACRGCSAWGKGVCFCTLGSMKMY